MPAKLPIWSARKHLRRMGVEQQGASAPLPEEFDLSQPPGARLPLRSLGPAVLMVEHEDLSSTYSGSLGGCSVAGVCSN